MPLPATINSGLSWSDHKNTRHGPFEYSALPNETPLGGFQNTSTGATNGQISGSTGAGPIAVAHAQGIIASGTGSVTHLRVRLWRFGVVSDNITIELRANNAGRPSTAGNLSSVTVTGSSISTSPTTYNFALSSSVAVTAGTTYWVVIKRTGAANINQFIVWTGDTNDYAEGVRYRATTADSDAGWTGATNDGVDSPAQLLALGANWSVSDTANKHLYTVLLDKTNNHAEVWRSILTQNVKASYTATPTTMLNIGYTDQWDSAAQSFQVSTTASITHVTLRLNKQGTPTDDHVVELRSDNSGLPSATALHTATILASDIPGTAGDVVCAFSSSITLIAGTVYWIVLRRTGAASTVNFVRWHATTDNGYTNGSLAYTAGENSYYLPSGYDGLFSVYESSDKGPVGEVWTEQNAANHPAISTTTGTKSVDCVFDGSTIHVCYVASGGATIRIQSFDCATNAWGTTSAAGPNIANASVLGSAGYPFFLSLRSDGSYVVLHQGVAESIMGTAYRRAVYSRLSALGGTWTSNTAITSTAVQTQFDARTSLSGSSDRSHFFYSSSAGTVPILHRSLSSANALDTEGTVFGATNASQLYACGQPVLRGTELIVPFAGADVSGTPLGIARTTSGATPTWSTTIISPGTVSDPEFNTSNTGAVAVNNTTVYAFWSNDDQNAVYYDNDAGTGTWGTDVQFNASVTTGINISKITDAIGILYLDTSTVKYDILSLVSFPLFMPRILTVIRM
jgi:hypothetical protein